MKRIVIYIFVLVEFVTIGSIVLCAFGICNSTKVHTDYPIILTWLIIGLFAAVIAETKLRERWHI